MQLYHWTTAIQNKDNINIYNWTYLSSWSSNGHVEMVFKLDRRYTRQAVNAEEIMNAYQCIQLNTTTGIGKSDSTVIIS